MDLTGDVLDGDEVDRLDVFDIETATENRWWDKRVHLGGAQDEAALIGCHGQADKEVFVLPVRFVQRSLDFVSAAPGWVSCPSMVSRNQYPVEHCRKTSPNIEASTGLLPLRSSHDQDASPLA